MSTSANVSAPRAAMTSALPQLSKRALDELKKGTSVQVWFRCEPYKTVEAGVEKVENQRFLCSIHTAVIRHFSQKCRRELGANDSKRIQIPFPRECIQIVVSWMTAGGGNILSTLGVSYPKGDGKKLGILKNCATYLEIGSLAALIDKDIAAVLPALPKPVEKKAERLCYYCNKPGHIRRNCEEMTASFVNMEQGPTFSMRGTAPAAGTSAGSTEPKAAEAGSAEPKSAKPSSAEPKLAKASLTSKQPEPAKGDVTTKTSSTKEKLTPLWGTIRAKDSKGWSYQLSYKDIEMEVDWPETGGFCKVTGTATLDSW